MTQIERTTGDTHPLDLRGAKSAKGGDDPAFAAVLMSLSDDTEMPVAAPGRSEGKPSAEEATKGRKSHAAKGENDDDVTEDGSADANGDAPLPAAADPVGAIAMMLAAGPRNDGATSGRSGGPSTEDVSPVARAVDDASATLADWGGSTDIGPTASEADAALDAFASAAVQAGLKGLAGGAGAASIVDRRTHFAPVQSRALDSAARAPSAAQSEATKLDFGASDVVSDAGAQAGADIVRSDDAINIASLSEGEAGALQDLDEEAAARRPLMPERAAAERRAGGAEQRSPGSTPARSSPPAAPSAPTAVGSNSAPSAGGLQSPAAGSTASGAPVAPGRGLDQAISEAATSAAVAARQAGSDGTAPLRDSRNADEVRTGVEIPVPTTAAAGGERRATEAGDQSGRDGPARRNGAATLTRQNSPEARGAGLAATADAGVGERSAGAANATASGPAGPAGSTSGALPATQLQRLAGAIAAGAADLRAQTGDAAAALEQASVAGARDPVRTLDLQMHPATLGLVTVRMRLVGQSLELRVRAANPETARLLKADGGKLADLLSTSGYGTHILAIDAGGADTAGFISSVPQPSAGLADGGAAWSGTGDQGRQQDRPSGGEGNGAPRGRNDFGGLVENADETSSRDRPGAVYV